MQEFLKINYESLRKIFKKLKKNTKKFIFIQKLKIKEFYSDSFINNNESKLSNLIKELEALYLITFYKNESFRKEGMQ